MSMAFCGVCLYNGIGSDVKVEEAVSYLKAAATQGQNTLASLVTQYQYLKVRTVLLNVILLSGIC